MIRITLLAVVVALCSIGCGSTPTTGTTVPSETQKKDKELYEAIQRDSKKKLEAMDKQLSEWKEKADKATGDAKLAMEKRYNELKAQRDKFADQLNEFGKASGEAWEKLKDGLEKSATNLGDAFKKAADEFK